MIAIKNEENKTATIVIGKYFIKSPIIPGQNIKGIKAKMVVSVDEKIGIAILLDDICIAYLKQVYNFYLMNYFF